MFCNTCGHVIREDDRFCSGCGKKLNVVEMKQSGIKRQIQSNVQIGTHRIGNAVECLISKENNMVSDSNGTTYHIEQDGLRQIKGNEVSLLRNRFGQDVYIDNTCASLNYLDNCLYYRVYESNRLVLAQFNIETREEKVIFNMNFRDKERNKAFIVIDGRIYFSTYYDKLGGGARFCSIAIDGSDFLDHLQVPASDNEHDYSELSLLTYSESNILLRLRSTFLGDRIYQFDLNLRNTSLLSDLINGIRDGIIDESDIIGLDQARERIITGSSMTGRIEEYDFNGVCTKKWDKLAWERPLGNHNGYNHQPHSFYKDPYINVQNGFIVGIVYGAKNHYYQIFRANSDGSVIDLNCGDRMLDDIKVIDNWAYWRGYRVNIDSGEWMVLDSENSAYTLVSREN